MFPKTIEVNLADFIGMTRSQEDEVLAWHIQGVKLFKDMIQELEQHQGLTFFYWKEYQEWKRNGIRITQDFQPNTVKSSRRTTRRKATPKTGSKRSSTR